MKYEELQAFGSYREKHGDFLDNEIALQVLYTYLRQAQASLLYFEGSPRINLLHQYALLSDVKKKQILENLLRENSFQYATSIREAIYFLLGKRRELWHYKHLLHNPSLYPGVYEISTRKNLYEMRTILGNIKVQKANRVFKRDSTFQGRLVGCCFSKTHEFLFEHRDYQIVFAFQPNYFSEGSYHVYLERDGVVLDIASNAFYEDKASSEPLYSGNVLFKCSYDEALDIYRKLQQEMPEIMKTNDYMLYTIALYYDYQKNAKLKL